MSPTLLSAISSCCLSGLNEYDLCRAKIVLWSEYILENRERVSEQYECLLTRLQNVGDCSQLSEREMDELWLLISTAQSDILQDLITDQEAFALTQEEQDETILTLATKHSVATVTYAAAITSNVAAIPHDSVLKSTLTGDLTLNPPTNPTDGKRIRYNFVASGANRTVTLDADIKTATGSTFDGEIVSGSTRILELTYLGNRWALTQDLEFVA